MLYFSIQNRLQDGTSKVSEAASARRKHFREFKDFVAGAVLGEFEG